MSPMLAVRLTVPVPGFSRNSLPAAIPMLPPLTLMLPLVLIKPPAIWPGDVTVALVAVRLTVLMPPTESVMLAAPPAVTLMLLKLLDWFNVTDPLAEKVAVPGAVMTPAVCVTAPPVAKTCKPAGALLAGAVMLCAKFTPPPLLTNSTVPPALMAPLVLKLAELANRLTCPLVLMD